MQISFIATLIFLVGLTSCRQKSTVEVSVQPAEWFKVTSYPLCDDSRGIFLDIDKLTKYGRLKPYDTVQLVDEDSVIVSFDFITDCCRDFSGNVDLRQDTLFLKYGLRTHETTMCDCYCDYRMTYRIDKRERTWKALKIINEH